MLNIFMLSISLFFQYRERDFLRKSVAPLANEKPYTHLSKLMCFGFPFSTASGTWTRTAITGQRILSPSCLPIPPSRLKIGCKSTAFFAYTQEKRMKNNKFHEKSQKYLVISKKSTTFAPAFWKGRTFWYLARAVRDRSAKPGTAVRIRQVPPKAAWKSGFFV